MFGHVCAIEVREQLVGSGSLLPSCRSQCLNSDPQTWWQAPITMSLALEGFSYCIILMFT